MRESGGQLRGDKAGTKPEDWGWIDVDVDQDRGRRGPAARRRGSSSPTATTRATRPSSRAAPDARSPPHGEIALDIAFHSKLPQDLRAHGLRPRLLPRRAVVPEDRRLRAGRDARPRGRRLELPRLPRELRVLRRLRQLRRHLHGARRRSSSARPGKRVSETTKGGKTTYRYVQDERPRLRLDGGPALRSSRVHASIRRSDIPAGWSDAGRRRARHDARPSSRLKPVSVRLLLQPGPRARARALHRSRRRSALSFYGLWFGAYPYETLTVVDPPDDGVGSGGMEYPTFITGRRRRVAPALALRRASASSRTSRSTSSATSTGTAWSAPTSSRSPGSTRGSTPTPSTARWSSPTGRATSSSFPGGIGVGLDRRSRTASTPACPTSTRSTAAPGASPRATPTASTPT